jgi:hypothetical protein
MSVKWQELLDRFPFRLIEAEWFSIRLFAHSGFVRYSRGDRDLTLIYKVEEEVRKPLQRLFGSVGRSIILYIPSILKWDDGAAVDSDSSKAVITHICNTLKGHSGQCMVIVDDTLYEEVQRDADAADLAFKKQTKE